MKAAELLLNIDNDYNGHKQTIIKGISLKQGFNLCKELEEFTENKYSFVLEVWTDGNFTCYQKDYFPVENKTGRDRIIFTTS